MLMAIDVGYSHTKGATDGRRVLFPSVVGEVQEARLDLSLVNYDGYIQIEVGDAAYFVGRAAIEQSGLLTRRQDRNWIETPEYLALALSAITELSAATNLTVELVTGLPVNYYGDRNRLAGRLKGVHTARRAGRRATQRIEIDRVIILPQGLAAVLSEALDEQGKIRPGPLSEGMVGLLDIGGHTVNIATFKELKEIARLTASIAIGMWEPLNEIGRRINAVCPGLELRGHSIVEAVRALKVHYYGRPVDVSGIVQSVLKPFVRQILGEASAVWGTAAQLDAILIAGGGAEVVGAAIAAEYPHARVVSNPQWANVEGYLRFGRRVLT